MTNDFVPIEFKDEGEYNATILRLLVNNNAMMKLLIRLESEKLAEKNVSPHISEDDFKVELEEQRNLVNKKLNDLLREYKYEALAEINLQK